MRHLFMNAFRTLPLLAISLLTLAPTAWGDDFKPSQDSLPVPAPADATVLFQGAEQNLFLSKSGGPVDWPIDKETIISAKGQSRSNHIVSKLHFRDADIHVEFMLPEKGIGNSGVYIHGNYELQIINSTGKQKLTQQEIGAVYGFAPPLVNAGKGPGEWQVYDIRYRAPRRNKQGEITEEGSITAWLNGQLVQKDTKLSEPRSTYHPFRYNTTDYLKTIWEQQKATSVGPVFLQDHDNAVRFRNVWVRPLDDKAMMYTPAS